MTVWLCLRWNDLAPEVQGVFSDEAKASAACRDETYCIGPLTLDQPLPHSGVDWPGVYHPIRRPPNVT